MCVVLHLHIVSCWSFAFLDVFVYFEVTSFATDVVAWEVVATGVVATGVVATDVVATVVVATNAVLGS